MSKTKTIKSKIVVEEDISGTFGRIRFLGFPEIANGSYLVVTLEGGYSAKEYRLRMLEALKSHLA